MRLFLDLIPKFKVEKVFFFFIFPAVLVLVASKTQNNNPYIKCLQQIFLFP